jgi:hypothetical protein
MDWRVASINFNLSTIFRWVVSFRNGLINHSEKTPCYLLSIRRSGLHRRSGRFEAERSFASVGVELWFLDCPDQNLVTVSTELLRASSLETRSKHWSEILFFSFFLRFGSLRLLAFSKAKIAVQREKIGDCDGHTVHKLSQRRLTANWLAPQGTDFADER